MKGLGDAINCAARFIGDEPFAVLLGDIILQTEQPALAQLIGVYNKEQVSVIGVKAVPMDRVHQYDVIDLASEIKAGQPIEVKGFVEKPKPEVALSNLSIMGRYILTPNIFCVLNVTTPGAGGEIHLTDAIELLNHSERIIAHDVQGILHDIGSKLGFVQATIDYALERE